MKDRIRLLVDNLERDPGNENTVEEIEELITGDEADAFGEEIVSELAESRTRLTENGRFEVVCKLLEFEIALAGDKEKETSLLLEQAKILDDEMFDQKGAIASYRKAASLMDNPDEINQKVEEIEAEREKWQQIAETFQEQAEQATEASLKAHMLYSAAERVYKNHKRGKDIPSLLYSAIRADAGHVKAARLLERVLKERERWEELGELYVKLAEHRRSKDERAQMLLAAAHTYHHRMEDKDTAAIYYLEVLDLLPGNETALRFLVKFYEDQEDWDHLVAVYEDALNGRPSQEDELAMLMQVGMIHWRMRNNMEVAEEAFRRLRKLSPTHEGMLSFYRAYAKDTSDNSKLLHVLNEAQRLTNDSELQDELTKEIAQIAASDGGNVERAIDAWKSVLRKEPDNTEAMSELKRLYRDSEKWNALLDLLKSEAEALGPDEVADKVKIYEEIVKIYRDKLSLGTLVINTYKTILTLDPGNEEAQVALSHTYEKEGRWNDLISLISNRAAATENSEEKIGFLLQVADLWIQRFNNFNRAVGPLEEILTIDPANSRAIETLRSVYQKRRAWRPLLELMEKETEYLEGEHKRDRLKEMALLAQERLSDHALAIRLWKQVLEIDSETPEALSSLEKLTERAKDWDGLCGVLERRIERAGNDEERVALLTKLGIVLKERLKDPAAAAAAWKRVLEIRPGHAKSMRSLKEAYLAAQDWDALEELYTEAGDHEGLVEVLGIAADRISEPDTKKMLSFRCAEIYNDPIGQPDRSVRHYERVLSVDSKNERAARELVPIYRRGEKWNRLLNVLEVVLEYTEDAEERISIMDEMREISTSRMNNRALAFDWAAKAFAENPTDDSVRESLEEAAQSGDKYEELVLIYKEHLNDFTGKRRFKMMRHIAELSLTQLGEIEEAINGFRGILNELPGDLETLSALENIFRAHARWEDLIDIYERRIEMTEEEGERRDLMMEEARLFEEGMDQPEKAEERYQSVLEISPDDDQALRSLERLATMSEKWEDLTNILEKRRNLDTVDEEEWREISSRLGSIFDQQINDPEKSIAIYSELLARYSGDKTTIDAMEHFLRDESVRADVARIIEPHLQQNEDWRRLAWVLAILIESTEERLERLELQTRLSDIYGEKLDDKQVAFETLGAALKENPDNVTLWDRMTEIAREIDGLGDLAEKLGEAYHSGELDDASQTVLANRLAELYDTQLDRPAEAVQYYDKVFDSDSTSSLSFNFLESWYTGEEKWDELLALYKKALDNNSTVYTVLDLNLKICFIHEEVLQNVSEAILAYRSVMELDPENQQAIRALTQLYEDAERWEDLMELLESELFKAGGEEAVALRYRLGEIAEHRLNRLEDALEYYEQVLTEDPDHLKSQEALERLLEMPNLRLRCAKVLTKTYEHQGAAEPLTRVLMIGLDDEELDVTEKVEVLTRIAELRERRLSDPRGAFEALSSAFEMYPAKDELRIELARLALENDLNEQYAGVIDKVIPTVEDDIMLASRLMSEVAKLYDDQIGDLSRAENAYRRLLDLDPDNPETAMLAVKSLERILTGGESWEQLLEVLRNKVRLTDDPTDRKEILHRMAEIEESVLERIPKAVELFKEIVDFDDMDMRALLGLERLYEREEQWQELIEVLRQRSIVESSAGVRRDLLYRVAGLFEDRLDDIDEAIAAYIQVGEEAGPDRDSLAALARLYKKTERFRDLLDVYEAQEQMAGSPEERAELLFLMGDLLRSKLDEPDQAVTRLGEALGIDAHHAEARSSLEAMLESPVRLEAIQILKPLYESEANFEQLLKCSEIEADETQDPVERAQVLRNAAEVAEVGLGEPKRAFDLLGRSFRSGTASPDLNRILDDLERLAEVVGGNEDLTGLYRELGPDILDGDLQVRCNLKVAEIAHSLLDDLELAREYYVKVLDIDGENVSAMDALEQIYEQSGKHLELFEIYRRKAQYLMDDEAKKTILFKQARVCELNLEDLSGAISIYENIIEIDPMNPEAVEAMERLLPKMERWSDLMALLEQRAENEFDNRVTLLNRLGKLAETKLRDHEQALDYYGRVLEIDNGHQETLESLEAAMDEGERRGRVAEILEPVYKASGDWPKLVGALEAQLEFCDDSMGRKELLGNIGRLYEEQLGDLDKAFETFSRQFKEDIEDKSSWDILTRLASVLEIWPKLAEVYADALDDVVGDTPTTAELSFVLGEIYENRLGDPDKATAAYRRTLAFAPDDPKAFTAVERMLLATETWHELLELYRDAADASSDDERRKDFIFKIAEIQESANEDLDAAIEAFRNILDIDFKDERATKALDRLYYQAERFEDLADHLRAQIDQAGEPRERNDLRCRLGRVCEENLEDLASAVDVFEEALFEEGGGIVEPLSALEHLILEEEQRQRIASILEPIYRDTDEWKKLIVILRTQIEYVDDPPQKSAKWKEIADLHTERGQNYLLAFEALTRGFEVDPTDHHTLEEMVRLAEQVENWDELANVLKKVVDNIYDLDFKMRVLHLLGSTYDRRLDMPRKAIEAYQAILEINEADGKALDSLEALFNLIGDWEGLVNVLSMKASFAPEPSERAEILRTKASIHEDLMSSPEDAIDAYNQALDAEPDSLATLDALERLYENAAKWSELIEIKRRRVDIVTVEEDRLAIQRSIAQIFEEHFDDAFEAINAWRDVLDQSSRDEAAVAALDRLYTKESMFPELLDNLKIQRELVADQAARVDLSCRIGELQEKELSDLQGAIESYSDVLTQQPTHAQAIDALTRLAADETVRREAIAVLEPLHRQAERWDKLAEIIELKLNIMDDPTARLNELMNLAELHETGRSDPLAAFEVYARALETEPSRTDIMESIERLAESQGIWDRVTDLYKDLSGKVLDAETEWAILARLGEAMEVHRADSKGAIEAYRKALDGGASDLKILSALDRLYEREHQWRDLDEILDREIEIAEGVEEANLFKLRQGTIREREFGDVAGAIGSFRDVVEASPQNDEAVAALHGLLTKDDFVEEIVEVLSVVYAARGEKEPITELFEHRLRVAGSDIEKIDLYRDLAAHNETTLNDLSAAFDAYGKAFLINPEDQTLLDELERLASELGAWAALVDTVEQVLGSEALDSSAAVDLGLKVAKWAATNVGDPAKAEALYRKVLEREPERQEALAALESLLKNLGRFDDLLPIMKRRADASYDFAQKKELYQEIAQINRVELGKPEEAIEAYNTVRELDETDLGALDALIEINEELSKFDSLVDLLLARAENTPDPKESNTFRHRAVALYVGPMENPAQAVDVYRSVLEYDPSDSEASAGLERLYNQLEQWTDLSDLLMQRLDTTETGEERASLLKQLAALSEERFSEPEDAITHLSDVLMIDPDDADAIESLRRLYTKTERWQDLVELLENRADRARETGDREGELGFLTRVGEIWDERLQDPDRATEIYERVLEQDPEHTRALAALAKLYEAAEDWERCAEVLTKAAAAGRGGPDEAEVHYRLARLNENNIGDEDKAVEELRLAVNLDPSHMEANKALAEHCRKRGDDQGLLEALMREEANIEDPAEKVSKLKEIADLQINKLGDNAGAVEWLERSRELAPDNKEVLLALSDAYVAAGRQDDAIPVIESLIDAETNGGKKRSRNAAVYHNSLANAYFAKGEQDKGIEHLEAAHKMDISNLDVLVGLGKLYYEREDYDKAAKLFRALLLQRFDNISGLTKADVYWYVGDISLKQGDKRKAKGMFQRGLDENKDHEACKLGLSACD